MGSSVYPKAHRVCVPFLVSLWAAVGSFDTCCPTGSWSRAWGSDVYSLPSKSQLCLFLTVWLCWSFGPSVLSFVFLLQKKFYRALPGPDVNHELKSVDQFGQDSHLFFFFLLLWVVCGLLVTHQGLKPRPWQGKRGVLTTGPPENSRTAIFNIFQPINMNVFLFV